MIPTGNVREYLIQKSSRSYLQQFTDQRTKFLVIEIETTEIDSFLMPDRNNKAPVWVEGGFSNLAVQMKINIPKSGCPYRSRSQFGIQSDVPNYVNDQRHAYANDERFGFSPMSSLVLFLANKIAVVLTDVLPSEHHLGGCFHELD